MHILTMTTLFPNALQPHHAVFIRTRMEQYVRKYGHRWTVVAPVPYFPKLPFKSRKTYDVFARIPTFENQRGYPVHHPRYLVTPMLGMRHYGSWMTAGVRPLIKIINEIENIDIIDGHYVYPDGTAAVRIGIEMGIPVVLSARGTDLNHYPGLPGIAALIRSNLRGCRHLICVCEGLRREALKLDLDAQKISVIGNGVDAGRFLRGDRYHARESLRLPQEATVILSVGHLTERKGFHLLIEACARLSREDVFLVIVGDGPEKQRLEKLARVLNVGGRIRFQGAVPNDDLPAFYQAADLFALASSREGWPNVLCEAQACGVPVVATDVWGIPEIISGESFGLLVRERSAEGMRAALQQALARDWDRNLIESVGRKRTWDRVADELEQVFSMVASQVPIANSAAWSSTWW